ncbi:UDP-N-acetylmuramoyl-tripeptide--D-alanyl-D-alanine ligase [Mesorhizobium sp. M0622]|uniref:UDP-N-acetylmuramoyl-tripeptide--D-alanyl-D- alanine ligase n=1 Tax=unclassified Mesorhizobium TaxID=325217 RepID=UPI0033393733
MAELAEITAGIWEGDLPEDWTTDRIAFCDALIGPGALVIPCVGTYRYGVHTRKIRRFRRQGLALLADREYRSNFEYLPLLRVASVRVAMKYLAKRARAAYGGRLIAVGGSVGKTSTKAMINAILTATGYQPFPDKNFNTNSGVYGEIANLPRDGFHVFEVSIGFYRKLSALALKPHVALITTIGDAHLEEYGSREAIAKLKARLYDVAKGGTAIMPRDSEHFEYLRARALSFGAKVVSFGEHAKADYRLVDYSPEDQLVHAVLKGRDFAYKLGNPGRHMAVNSLSALAAVDSLGLDLGAATNALAEVEAIPGRGEVIRIALASGEIHIVDEAYNANPTSVAAVLAALAEGQRASGGRKLALLGDMRELGPRSAEFHAGLAEPVLAADLDMVMTVGTQMTYLRRALPEYLLGPHFATADDVLPELATILRAKDLLLVKASNAMGLDEVVTRLRRQLDSRLGPP